MRRKRQASMSPTSATAATGALTQRDASPLSHGLTTAHTHRQRQEYAPTARPQTMSGGSTSTTTAYMPRQDSTLTSSTSRTPEWPITTRTGCGRKWLSRPGQATDTSTQTAWHSTPQRRTTSMLAPSQACMNTATTSSWQPTRHTTLR